MLVNPGSIGTQWGLRLAIQASRVLPPGAVQRTKLVWQRCKEDHRNCEFRGPVLICGRCWDTEHVFAGLVILGPLDAPLGAECERCGGRDGEVQYEHSPEIERQVAEIATWNAELNRQTKKGRT